MIEQIELQYSVQEKEGTYEVDQFVNGNNMKIHFCLTF